MQDKKKTIKIIALLLLSIIFLIMFYMTFFNAKKKSDSPVVKETPDRPATAQPPAPPVRDEAGNKGLNDDPAENIPVLFKEKIKNIFIPCDAGKTALEKNPETPDPLKKSAKLSEQEEIDIKKTLQFKGAMLSNTHTVAVINGAFIHVGDTVNGYKVTSISEKQVTLDTGRGMIILEIMKHE